MGEEAIQHCRGYALEAERKMGQMLAKSEKAKGTRGQLKGKDVSGDTIMVLPEDVQTLKELGLSLKESASAQMLASLPDFAR